jgi:Holliday junction resolvase RusA-like endonuclease
MAGIIYENDAHIVELNMKKVYADLHQMEVTIERIML